MDEYANSYAAYILELIEAAKETWGDPVVLIEQRVDFSRWGEGSWELVEGRSNRRYTNETAVIQTVSDADFDPYERKLLGITQKLLNIFKYWCGASLSLCCGVFVFSSSSAISYLAAFNYTTGKMDAQYHSVN